MSVISRIVVSFVLDPRSDKFGLRVSKLKNQAESLGAHLCALASRSVSFAFDAEDAEAALELATNAVGNDAKIRAGVSFGEVTEIQRFEGFGALIWGRPLVVSTGLAESAHGGEVLIDPLVPLPPSFANDALSRWASGDIEPVRATSIVPSALHAQPTIDVEVDLEDSRVSELPPPTTVASHFVESARQALKRGDVHALDSALAELRSSGEHPTLVERLQGFVSLTRGAKDDALRTLRKAAETEERLTLRARARLAYAVALATAGRPESALLEGLRALATARETDDRTGEVACARFLSQVSQAAGHANAASRWEQAAELASESIS